MGFKLTVNVNVVNELFGDLEGVHVTVMERGRDQALASAVTNSNGWSFQTVDVSDDPEGQPRDIFVLCAKGGYQLAAAVLYQASEPYFGGNDTVKTHTYDGVVMMVGGSGPNPTAVGSAGSGDLNPG